MVFVFYYESYSHGKGSDFANKQHFLYNNFYKFIYNHSMNNKYNVLPAKDWQLLSLSGEDCKKFLQGHLTCNLTKLTKKNPLLGAACDTKGRVVASVFLIKSDKADEILILLPADTIDLLLELWNKYLILYRKTQIKKLKGNFELLEMKATDTNIKIKQGVLGPVLAKSNVFISLLDGTSHETQAQAREENQEEQGPKMPHSKEDWNTLLIKKKIPFVRATSSGQMTPQMLNYDKLNAISWEKGCYLGQEVVARIHYKGKSARSCYKVSFDNKQRIQLRVNMSLHSIVNNKTNEVGKLLNYCHSHDSRYLGIALLNNNLVDMQNVFLSGSDTDKILDDKANSIPINVSIY